MKAQVDRSVASSSSSSLAAPAVRRPAARRSSLRVHAVAELEKIALNGRPKPGVPEGTPVVQPLDLPSRPRRNRRSETVRRAFSETIVHPANFILPVFVHDGDKNIPIDSMPGVARLGWRNGLLEAVAEARSFGVNQAPPLAAPPPPPPAKYASAFYGPFRDALASAPKPGELHRVIPPNKKTYQQDPANYRESLREARADEAEGLPYLDVIRLLRDNTPLPIAAYHVSGEYAMLKAAVERGWLVEKDAVLEALTSLRRAGADLILTYYATQAARWMADDAPAWR
eukprot:scaffold3.g6504.t1